MDASVMFGAVERNGLRRSSSRRVLREGQGPYVTTEACLTEAFHLAGSRIGWQAQDEIWQIVASTALSVVAAEMVLAEKLMRRYRDVPMDFADATLVALASVEPRLRVATFNSDFTVYRRDDNTPVPLVDDRRLGWS